MRRSIKRIGFLVLLGQSWSSCSDNKFRSPKPAAVPTEASPADPGPGAEALPELPSGEPPLARMLLPITNTEEQRFQTFQYGEANPKVDYLFILDNSSSMTGILANTQAGFASLFTQGSAVFSPDSKIAVMSTMIGDTNNLAMPGLGINPYPGIELEPGFLDFVDQTAIVNYRTKVPARAQRWSLDGCKQKWFSPNDNNEKGESCFRAAVQTTGFSVGGEPGIHAYQQLLQKNSKKPIFRTGARVNVIFISDTHDPGINEPTLLANIPSYAQLLAATQVDNRIAALRFHAIAPDSTSCTAEDIYTKSYYKLANDSQGEKIDVCLVTNYTEFLMKMVAKSKVVEPLFKLAAPSDQILSVLVDGKPSKDYELSETKDSLRFSGLDPLKPAVIKVIYRSLPPK